MRAFAQAPSAEPTRRGNGSTFPLGALAAMFVCAAAFLGIGAPAASAAPEAQPGYAFLTSFGEGEVSGSFHPYYNPIAVNDAGDVFAVDFNHGLVRIFSPDASAGGVPLTSFSTGAGVLPADIAVDRATGDIYVQDTDTPLTVKRFVSDGQPSPTYTVDPDFEVSSGQGIVVDPTTNDLLIADGSAESIRRIDTTGALVETISTPSIAPQRIAVAADGSLYVSQESSQDVTHLSGTGTVLGTIAGVGSISALTVDQTSGRIAVLADGQMKLYDSAGAFLSQSPASGENGIAIGGSSSRLYAFTGGSVNTYVPATKPGLEAPVVSEIETQSAHVEAEVDPGAGPPEGSVAHFEYSDDGGLTWTSTPDEGVERTGTEGPDTIEADLTGLILNTEYLVRVKASNSLWPAALSPTTSTGTLEIAPIVETGAAGDRTETGALLYGTVNPAGLQTTYHFEYGTTTSYGSRVPLDTEAPAGNRRVPRTVQKLISGLQPGTTYHYRLVAENASGETVGDDRTFTTLQPDELFPQRAYEQVTPVDKGGAVVQSDFHVQTAPDGSAIAVSAAAASEDAGSALIFQNYLSRRAESNWLDWTAIDPPQDVTAGLNEAATAAISDDSEHALVISNRALAAGGVDGSGNLYVKDLLTGAYTFVGSAPGADGWRALVGIQLNERIFLAGAPDFSWILFWGIPQFLPEASTPAIYRWTRATGELKVESRLPDGTATTSPVQVADGYQRELPSASTDGSVLAFGAAGIFRRENGQTTALSVSRVTGDPNDEVQPALFDGMTPDGRYVFFHGPIQLTDDAPPANPGTDNLYRYDAATDELLYLAPILPGTPLSMYGLSNDGQKVYFDDGGRTVVWDAGTVREVTADRPANTLVRATTTVSPSGRYFAWEDEAHVVYLYDAELDESSCASCPADGSAGGGARMMAIGRGIDNQAPRALLDDGTVFFDTPVRLLAADHNGAKDVYAYKDGRLDLISPGNEDFDAFFVDASEDGSSVFFQTGQGLVGQDTDGNADVYVARVGGGFASQNPPPPPGSCQGAECAEAGGQPAVGPPVSTAVAANPAISHKKHKKHKKHRHRKHKKHKHMGHGHKRENRGN